MHHLNFLKNMRPRTFNQLHGYVKRKQIPLAAGGKDQYSNLQLLHKDCHKEKTDIDRLNKTKLKQPKLRDKTESSATRNYVSRAKRQAQQQDAAE